MAASRSAGPATSVTSPDSSGWAVSAAAAATPSSGLAEGGLPNASWATARDTARSVA